MVKRYSYGEKKSPHWAMSYSREYQPKTHNGVSVNKQQKGDYHD